MTTLERIRKKFHEGCADYGLLADGDRVLVALSGGKDSLLLARLLAERSRLHKPHISVEAAHVIMDNIPYETERTYLEDYCAALGLKLHILHTRFEDTPSADIGQAPAETNRDRRRRKTKCFLCSWNRRKALFRFAEAEGFNKIALGHHQDDILTTWLMNLTFEGQNDTMRPLVPMEHYPLSIIRPLCLVHEEWIKEVAASEGFEHQKTPCPYETATRRNDMNRIFHELQALNPEARFCLWRALGLKPITESSKNRTIEKSNNRIIE